MPFFHKNVSQKQVPIQFAILSRGLQLKKLSRSRCFELHKGKSKWSRTSYKIVKKKKSASIPVIFGNKCSMVFVKKKEKVVIVKIKVICLGQYFIEPSEIF